MGPPPAPPADAGTPAREDWSRRVRGPTGAMHGWFLGRLIANYADAHLALFHRYGDVVRVRYPNRALCLFRPRHLKHVLRTNVLNYPKSYEYEMLRPILGDGIFVSDGDLWARQRRLLAPEFREGAAARFLPAMVECAERLFREWDAATGPVDVTADMMRLTLWIVGRAMFKSEFGEEAERIGHALEVCLAHATLRALSMGLYAPWLPTRGNREAREAASALDGAITKIIARGRAGDLGAHDVLSRMILAKDADTGGAMTDQQLLDETKSLVLAGHETTSLALSWAFYLLARHPEAGRRLAEEAARVLGDRTPTAQDVPKLAYARMVFLETLRLYPPVPALSRGVLKPDEIDGVRVEPDELVAIAPYATHRHPEYWPDPERFDPERFAEGRVEGIEPYSYLPFLLGRRQCLGEHFAMLEGVVLLAMIARRYRLARVDHAPIATRPITTLRLARPLLMRVSARAA